MGRFLVIAAAIVAACTASKGDPHKFGPCIGSALVMTQIECEAACADPPPTPHPGPSCGSAFSPNRPGVMYACGTQGTFVWEDTVHGCCKNDIGSDGGRQIFAECN